MLGDGGVGKSALLARYLNGSFDPNYAPTVEEAARKSVVVDGENLYLNILDTAGQEEFASVRDMQIQENQGFLLLYSINSASSLSEVENLKRRIDVIKEGENTPVVLVGCKADLESERAVTYSQGNKLAGGWGAPFVETSAKSGTNHDIAFEEIARAVLKSTASPGQRQEQKAKCLLM